MSREERELMAGKGLGWCAGLGRGGVKRTQPGCVEELGNGRNGALTGSTLGGGGRRRLVWRAGDACAMNQLSKYGPCSSSQHARPLPAQSGWTSPSSSSSSASPPLPRTVYHCTLLETMRECPQHHSLYLSLSVSNISSNDVHNPFHRYSS